MKKVLIWLLLGTKGGYNRARIIKFLHDMPSNANKLATELNLNYRTITHHLSVLDEMNVIISVGKKYGKVYMLSTEMEKNYGEFDKIWNNMGSN